MASESAPLTLAYAIAVACSAGIHKHTATAWDLVSRYRYMRIDSKHNPEQRAESRQSSK